MLWCRFRITGYLWTDYIWNNYYKKLIPTQGQWKSGSQVWKKMLEARDDTEQEIRQEPIVGSSNIQFDNWTRLGSLYHVVSFDFIFDEDAGDVDILMSDVGWNSRNMSEVLPLDTVLLLVDTISISNEKPLWVSLGGCQKIMENLYF